MPEYTNSLSTQTPVSPSGNRNILYSESTGRITSAVPSHERDLDITPIAYQYEYWSGMCEDWVETIQHSSETMPDPTHEDIRNVEPLVPLSEVETLARELLRSGCIDFCSDDAIDGVE